MKSDDLKAQRILMIFITFIKFTKCFNQLNDNLNDDKKDNLHLEVRAVMENPKDYSDGETLRFQREELFKHHSLHDCKQKLAVTVKMSSNPGKSSGDEYIPIEHVFDADKKRIRLLNPYVLRLQRRLPFEAYSLKRIDTVSGIIVEGEAKEDALVNLTMFNNRIKREFSKLNYNLVANTFDSQSSPTDFKNEGNTGEHESNLQDLDNFKRNINTQCKKQNLKSSEVGLTKSLTKYFFTDSTESSILVPEEMGHNKNLKKKIFEGSSVVHGNIKNQEKDFAIYEIGDPQLWYSTHLELFEKLITPQGKTLWNDLTKEKTARVSTKNPKWLNRDISIHLKPVEFLTREDYALPLQKLCLIVPLKFAEEKFLGDKQDLLIVPMDDIITLSDEKEIQKRNFHANENVSEYTSNDSQQYRRVLVRATRVLMDSRIRFNLMKRGSEQFLKVPHNRPHHSQIDIEAKADDNELVLVGAFGRLMTIVSDSTRRSRSVLTVQATNMGLAAAPFRVVIRECTPVLMENTRGESSIATSLTLLPPRHTQTFHLDIPLKTPMDKAHCIVAMVNENEEVVAVRDVTIKKDDRCFCVWYCDCVCLSEDPKLLCRSLPKVQLLAAGLPTQGTARHIRSICYPDLATVNLFVTIVGVLFALFQLGLIKACLGLIFRCVGSWGLHLLLQTPRKLDRYYERSLRSRRVEYDKEGWPVHPDTKQRNIRLVSKPMEFILNIMFFIILPCTLIWDAVRKLTLRCQSSGQMPYGKYSKNDSKKCFSSHDVQGFELLHQGRHRGLHKWMSPHAEALSNNVVEKGLTPEGCNLKQCDGKINYQLSCMDSEQDDTEYIMMQMNKSRESLAKCHRKVEKSEDIEMNAANKKR